MSVSWKKKTVLWLCALAMCWNGSLTAAAADPDGDTGTGDPPALGGAANPDGDSGTQESAGESYTAILDSCTIAEGESLNYTTVSSAFAGEPMEEGYYPGELTIQLTGTVIVEAGGSLGIGTLSIGGPEAHPVLTGTGQIIVKAGGQLRLTCVVLEPQGQGPMIVQEDGGSVELTATPAAEGAVQWGAPLVNNRYQSPDDLWLEAGTVLTEDMLPASMEIDIQEMGQEVYMEIPLSWDLTGYDGRTRGELVLPGVFLGEDGQPLPSLEPLEITVHWYEAGVLVVTGAEWKGSTVPTVQLTLEELPEDADLIWGEVSRDGGTTWERWEDADGFFVVEIEPEGWACIFELPDETPGLFRVAAETAWWFDGYACWRSEAFALSPPEDGEDSGGNRGGSTTPDPPEREPEPADRPDPDREDSDTDRDDDPSLTVPPPQNEEQPEDEAVQETLPDPPETWLLEDEPIYAWETEEGTAEEPAASGREPAVSTSEAAPLTGAGSGEKEDLVWKIDGQLPETTSGQASEPDAEPESPASEPEAEPNPAELTQEEPGPASPDQGTGSMPVPIQSLMAAAGIGVCAAGGMAAAGLGPFRKKK